MNDLTLRKALYETLASLPEEHHVRLHFIRSPHPPLLWLKRVKHNTGPDWDDFRLKLIEKIHL